MHINGCTLDCGKYGSLLDFSDVSFSSWQMELKVNRLFVKALRHQYCQSLLKTASLTPLHLQIPRQLNIVQSSGHLLF